jgi:type I thyroxine 5'-deiodinase
MATPDGAVMEEPRTLAERTDHAGHCMGTLDLAPIPALVDDMEDTANRLYEAWPDRLILVDRNGRVAYRSAPGPFGFDVEELDRAIERELARRESS